MGPAGRPAVLAVAVRWPGGQSESWRERPARQRGPGINACPAGRISPAARPAGRPAYGVDASFTLFLGRVCY